MSQEWSRVVSLKGLLKSIYEKSSDLSGTIVYSKYPGMLSPSRNLVSSGPDNVKSSEEHERRGLERALQRA